MRESDRAYQEIINFLILGKIKTGEQVDEKVLLEKINVGRTPLREALTRLAQDGYINVLPRKGMVFLNLAISDITSLFNLRTELSEYMAKLLVQAVTEEDIKELEEFLDENNKFNFSNSDYLIKDLEFHRKVNSLTRDKYLCEIMNKLQTLSIIVLQPSFKDFITNETIAKSEYIDIIASLKEKDVQKLTSALRVHIPKYIVKYG